MKKRVMSVLLALCMAVALVPAKAQAEELPKLAIPTELQWGIEYRNLEGTETRNVPGMASWKNNQPTQNNYRFCLYRLGDDEPEESRLLGFPEAAYESFSHFITGAFDFHRKSGTYFFTVKALGDGINYADSEESQPSAYFEYTCPNAKLAAPTTVKWDWPAAKFKISEDTDRVFEYETAFLFSKTENGEKKFVGSSYSTISSDDLEIEFGDEISENMLQKYAHVR